jgi:hypothetical protein
VAGGGRFLALGRGALADRIRDANPFYDASYSVNSANLGPYGDAIVRELILRDENLFEQAVGTRGRSAGQWAIWEAVYGPVAADGYPQPSGTRSRAQSIGRWRRTGSSTTI